MQIYNWDSVYDLFDALNKGNVRYVVMRNFEKMNNDNFFCDGHEDIDILCEDAGQFMSVSNTICKMIPEDNIHLATFIGGKMIPIDLRHQGDNYYDELWEKDILERRIMANNGNWYIMSDEDYYYSLIYHAILQKSCINPMYINKLNKMSEGLGINSKNYQEHLKKLDDYMNKFGYQYVQPSDASVPFQWHYVNGGYKKLNADWVAHNKVSILCRKIYRGGGNASRPVKIRNTSISASMAV